MHEFWGNISKTGCWSLPKVTHWRRPQKSSTWIDVFLKTGWRLWVLLEGLCSNVETDRAPEEVALHQGGVGHLRGGEAPEAERRRHAKPRGNVYKEIPKYPRTKSESIFWRKKKTRRSKQLLSMHMMSRKRLTTSCQALVLALVPKSLS